MYLWCLDPLVSGEIPEHRNWSKLNDKRQGIVKQYVIDIPKKYSVAEIQKDVDKLKVIKHNRVYKFVACFRLIALATAAVFFVLYWFLFGFWKGIITGAVILVCSYYLDNRLGPLVGLSNDSVRLLVDYESLMNRLVAAQEKENEALKEKKQ